MENRDEKYWSVPTQDKLSAPVDGSMIEQTLKEC
jgi:hypothetical protein